MYTVIMTAMYKCLVMMAEMGGDKGERVGLVGNKGGGYSGDTK